MPDEPRKQLQFGHERGIFQGFLFQLKLIIRLIKDKRVNPLLKVLPLSTLIYLVLPDILPGPVDDAMIIWLGSYLFIELCPQDVVKEHRQILSQGRKNEWDEAQSNEIIEGEFRDADDHE